MACSDHDLWINALDAGTMAIRDAVFCPYQSSMGFGVFATLVLVGIIGVPIYVRTQSIILPFVLALIIGGVVLSQLVAMAQTLVIVVILLVFGIVPVILLRRRLR